MEPDFTQTVCGIRLFFRSTVMAACGFGFSAVDSGQVHLGNTSSTLTEIFLTHCIGEALLKNSETTDQLVEFDQNIAKFPVRVQFHEVLRCSATQQLSTTNVKRQLRRRDADKTLNQRTFGGFGQRLNKSVEDSGCSLFQAQPSVT